VKTGILLSSLCLLLISGESSKASEQLLKRRMVFTNPPTYVLNRMVTTQRWGVELFGACYSGAMGYIANVQAGTLYLDHSISVFADPYWNRLLYMDDTYNDGSNFQIREYGSHGSGNQNFNAPYAVDVLMPIDANHFASYYNIFVADKRNDRIERIRYRWTTPDSGLIHVAYYTDPQIIRPIDLDINNAGTFYPGTDDYIWVACENDKIHAISVNTGTVSVSYGTTGSGVGHFRGVKAIACGRSSSSYANNSDIYVADSGNSRLVWLSWSGTSVQWLGTFSDPTSGELFTDLEVDNFGQVWVTSSDGMIFKFTRTLKPLGVFGSAGSGVDQFNSPLSIGNTGGYLGGGDMLVTEQWSPESGIQYYAISTDVKDLYVNPFLDGANCRCQICFTLIDWSFVNVKIYNQQGALVRDLMNGSNQYMTSSVQVVPWDGKDDTGQYVQWNTYRVEVTAVSPYTDITVNQPVNTVVKSTWVTLCQGACNSCGDANSDGTIDIADATYLMAYIFSGGPAPADCNYANGMGDANGDGEIDISDAVYLVSYIFSGGAAPHCA
jgi:hypothetical protein